jgi:hypothetical protein
MVCRRRPWRSDRYGQIADSVRAEGAVRGTACFADPCPFCPVTRAPGLLASLVHSAHPGRPVLRRSARDGRRAGLVRTRGGAGFRIGPRHPVEGSHGSGDRVRAAHPPGGRLARRRGERRWPRIWALREPRRHAARVSRYPLAGTGSG